MHSCRRFDGRVHARIAACLAFAPLAVACGGPAPGAAREDLGASIYAMHCMACHQRDGRGLDEAQPSLAGSATVAGDPQALAAWVMFGERPPTLAPRRSVVVMPQFAWLSDEQLAAVLSHVGGRCGNAQPASAAGGVAAWRALREGRGP